MSLCTSERRRVWGNLCTDRLFGHSSLASQAPIHALAASSPNWAEITTACIAFLALVGAVIQLLGARRSTQRRNAFAYFERYSSPEALPYIAEMTTLLAKSKPPKDDDTRWDEWNKKDLSARLSTLVFVNFWEELGGLYNRRLVARSVIRIYLGALLVELWDEGKWFLDRCKADEHRAFEEWEQMAAHTRKWLHKRDHPNRWRRAEIAVMRTLKRR